jgi:hypothetical protein
LLCKSLDKLTKPSSNIRYDRGYAPQKRQVGQVSEEELKSVLKRGEALQQVDETERDIRAREADRVQGLGFQQRQVH